MRATVARRFAAGFFFVVAVFFGAAAVVGSGTALGACGSAAVVGGGGALGGVDGLDGPAAGAETGAEGADGTVADPSACPESFHGVGGVGLGTTSVALSGGRTAPGMPTDGGGISHAPGVPTPPPFHGVVGAGFGTTSDTGHGLSVARASRATTNEPSATHAASTEQATRGFTAFALRKAAAS